ncbi:hypothetical protein NL676_024624 [Syzygium grande]|nr:hypothetical protein NL676_024624 [Syzygium grande]
MQSTIPPLQKKIPVKNTAENAIPPPNNSRDPSAGITAAPPRNHSKTPPGIATSTPPLVGIATSTTTPPRNLICDHLPESLRPPSRNRDPTPPKSRSRPP